jgi:hypothetical protein
MFSLEGQLVGFHVDTEGFGHSDDFVHLSFHGGLAKLNNWSHDELNEASLELLSIISKRVVLPLLGGCVKVVVTPKFLLHLVLFDTEFL